MINLLSGGIPRDPQNLLKWCQDNLRYINYPNFTRTPPEVLKDKQGNCVDLAYLIGIVLQCSGWIVRFPFALVQTSKSRDPHVWVQFFDEGSQTWVDLDATNKKHKIGDHYPILKMYSKQPNLERFGAVEGGCKRWTKILK